MDVWCLADYPQSAPFVDFLLDGQGQTFDPAVLRDAMRRFVDGVGMGAMAPTDQ